MNCWTWVVGLRAELRPRRPALRPSTSALLQLPRAAFFSTTSALTAAFAGALAFAPAAFSGAASDLGDRRPAATAAVEPGRGARGVMPATAAATPNETRTSRLAGSIAWLASRIRHCHRAAGPRSSRLKYSSSPARNSSGSDGPGLAGRLRDAAVLADLLLVDAAAEQGQGRVLGRAAAAAARARAAAAAALGVDPLRLEQQLDRLGLRGDRRARRSRAGRGSRSPRPSPSATWPSRPIS